MTSDPSRLERECRTFTRLLTGARATPYVIGKYVDAHRVRQTFQISDAFERALVDAASSGPVMARLADAYARRAMPRGVLRKKLVLLLAILETSHEFHRDVDTGPDRSVPGALFSLVADGATGIMTAVAGVLLFSVMRLVARSPRRPS